MLLIDAMLFWVMAVPSEPAGAALLRSLHTLSYLAGGVFLLLPLAAFIGALCAVAKRAGLLPRWIVWWGAAATIEAVLYGTTLAMWERTVEPKRAARGRRRAARRVGPHRQHFAVLEPIGSMNPGAVRRSRFSFLACINA